MKPLALLRDPDEEALVEAIVAGLSMLRVGFIFMQAIDRDRDTGEYTIYGQEVLQVAKT